MKQDTTLFIILMVLAIATGCRKEDPVPPDNAYLKSYSLTNIQNAIVKDAKCGIDLSNGVLYTVPEGYQHQNNVDIAYGYMNYGPDPRYERCFLALSYAACACGGSSGFSYGDQNNPRTGYNSYSVRNKTRLKMSATAVDFDAAKFFTAKEQFDAIFQATDNAASADEAFFSSQDNLAPNPYVFFQTVSGKRGIIRIKGYTKNIGTDYQLQTNPINIDVLIEK